MIVSKYAHAGAQKRVWKYLHKPSTKCHKTISRSHISQNISNIKATDLIGTLVEEHLEIGPVSQTIIAVILIISISIRIDIWNERNELRSPIHSNHKHMRRVHTFLFYQAANINLDICLSHAREHSHSGTTHPGTWGSYVPSVTSGGSWWGSPVPYPKNMPAGLNIHII